MTRWVQASDVQVQASDVQDEATVTVVSVPGPLSSGVMSQALSLFLSLAGHSVAAAAACSEEMGESGGHVLRDTASRDLCGRV